MAEERGPPLGPSETECPVCGDVMTGLHCERTCRNCGYLEDCSDLFTAGPLEPPRQEGLRPPGGGS